MIANMGPRALGPVLAQLLIVVALAALPVGSVRGRITMALDLAHRAMGLLAGVTFTPEEAAENAFLRLLRVMKLITEDTSFRYHQGQEALARLVREMGGDPLAAGRAADTMVRLTDSWRHIDQAAWEALRFPELR